MIESELKLAHSEEKFKLLFEFSPIGMAMVEQETGKFIEVNQTLLDYTGYSKSELLSLSFWDITPKGYEEQEKEQYEALNKYNRFGPNEKEYIKKDGTTFPIRISGFSLEQEDGKKVVWGLIEDITTTKHYELIYKDNKELLEYVAIENSLDKLLKRIVLLAEKRCYPSKCSILLLDKSKGRLFTGAAPSLPDFYNDAVNGTKIGKKIGSCGEAAFTKERVIVENIDEHENWQRFLKYSQKANLHSCWSEPIISSSNEILGTFAIYNEKPSSPNIYDLKYIETYANIASKAIEKHEHTIVLKNREKDLKLLFDNSHSGLVYVSKEGKIIDANHRFAEMMGYDSEKEFIGLNTNIFHLSEKKRNEFYKKSHPSLIENKTFDIEYKLKGKGDITVWCRMSGKALDENRPADLSKGILWTINDISLRKKYEEQLNQKQILLRNILLTIPDMVWLKDQNGVYLACNSEFEKFFGDKEGNIVGKTDYDYVDKPLADFFRMHDKKAMKIDDVNINEEKVTYASDGREVLLHTSKKAMKDKDNNIIGVLGIGHDITELKKREEELEQLNKLANSLTESQQVLLSLFDKGDSVLLKWKNDEIWNIEYVSLSIKKLLGYSKEEFLNNEVDYFNCIHKDDLIRVKSEYKKSLNKQKDYFKHEPYRIITKEGEEKWVLDYTATQIDSENKVVNFIGYIIDITEQIKNQEMMYQQSKIASLGEMLGNISHQWRQPLSVIASVATGTKLKKEMGILEDNELMTNLDNINKHAQYLSSTIDDFRNFFLSDSHAKGRVNLNGAISKVVSLVKDSYKLKEINLILKLDDDLEFECNENLFIQALINILNNASDALNSIEDKEFDKYVFIDLFKKKDKCIICIKDNARGIKKEYINKIFEPYFTTKHQSQGTGIGLYMTNQIITKHLNGEIDVSNIEYSYLDKHYTGACFVIKLCLKNLN
ncbi:MAG: PAS domain S-box protein [Campylobacteraceae bacterium]|nr:PAS domain S-box protein [Campylobacteraceae bacterium]